MVPGRMAEVARWERAPRGRPRSSHAILLHKSHFASQGSFESRQADVVRAIQANRHVAQIVRPAQGQAQELASPGMLDPQCVGMQGLARDLAQQRGVVLGPGRPRMGPHAAIELIARDWMARFREVHPDLVAQAEAAEEHQVLRLIANPREAEWQNPKAIMICLVLGTMWTMNP